MKRRRFSTGKGLLVERKMIDSTQNRYVRRAQDTVLVLLDCDLHHLASWKIDESK